MRVKMPDVVNWQQAIQERTLLYGMVTKIAFLMNILAILEKYNDKVIPI